MVTVQCCSITVRVGIGKREKPSERTTVSVGSPRELQADRVSAGDSLILYSVHYILYTGAGTYSLVS